MTRPRAGLLSLVVVAGYVAATSPMGSIPGIPLRETLLGVAFGALIFLVVTFPAVEKAFAWRPMSMQRWRADFDGRTLMDRIKRSLGRS